MSSFAQRASETAPVFSPPLLSSDDDDKGAPERRCCVTRQHGSPEELLRFVAAPTGEIVPDFARRLEGRGAWLLPRRDILIRAVAERRLVLALTRKYRRHPHIPADTAEAFADSVCALLRRRIFETLGLARRAGLAVAGETKVRAALGEGAAALLLQASDGSPDGCARVAALAERAGVRVLRPFTADELGAAFGRDHHVHVLLKDGALSRRLRDELLVLRSLSGDDNSADGEEA